MHRFPPAGRLAITTALLAFALIPPPARSQSSEESHVTVKRTAAPEKRLDFEVTVPATVAQVWEALSTSKGLSTWLFPNAVVDLRPGGDWIVKFPGGSTGGGTIVAFVPQQKLEIAALAPD
jgi:Activator of Hsp90 ATPase homolog 1-like protein